ncbi:hypothetical protein [Paenibacillus flagellatus]|uniref:Uncharacterized protein n=1 Tax=Paenibacillus flagellatus TaxID=2211139 RepID=A0A2V5KG02_9BACL|nr:hypothetical protein [Paenibacillus flagellatus]PYI53070.1 hypothetical protein DLM86_18925 [Paenibacillus flagellatus]
MNMIEKEQIKGNPKLSVLEWMKKRWPSFVALAVAATGLPASTDPMSLILFLAALVYPISGAIRGHLRGVRTLVVQAIALALFGVIALVSVYVDRDAGLMLLAAGYIGHTIWDIAHFRTGKIVRRGYAEFCAVLDLLIAAVLLAPIFL